MKQPQSLKGRALQLLAQREQSKAELRRKLLAYARAEVAKAAKAAKPGSAVVMGGASFPADSETGAADGGVEAEARAEAEVEAVLIWLEAHRFLSTERFIESRINARAGRFGNLRIRYELAQHELSLPAEAEQALVASELSRARTVRAAKFSAAPASQSEHARQARFLAARGFSSDVIRRTLREAARPDRDAG